MISADLINQVKLGEIHFLSIKKTAIDKRGESCNSCDDNTADLNIPLAKEILSRGSEYTQSLFFNLCLFHFIEKYCNLVKTISCRQMEAIHAARNVFNPF